MLNATDILIHRLVQELELGLDQSYGAVNPDYRQALVAIAQQALTTIATSDAPYHNVEHTFLATLTGQALLQGKQHHEASVTCEDWLHCLIALLCHDIGYVRGVCQTDADGLYDTGIAEKRVPLALECTDASLAPYHVDRSKRFVTEHLSQFEFLDLQRIQHHIEMTRFPVPNQVFYQDTQSYSALVRSADLIGQLGDPRYLQKLTALFYELEETGCAQSLGYDCPATIRQRYPNFYRQSVEPLIQDSLQYLSFTPQGQEVLEVLQTNLDAVTQEQQPLVPMLLLHR